MGLGVFSPGLDRFGNSVRGVAVCQELSDRYGLHLFATEPEDAALVTARAEHASPEAARRLAAA